MKVDSNLSVAQAIAARAGAEDGAKSGEFGKMLGASGGGTVAVETGLIPRGNLTLLPPPGGQPLSDFRVGTNAAEVLKGDARDNIMTALGGNDTLRGGRGDDTMKGGSGDDVMRGGRGDDRLEGNTGSDIYRGGRGTDTAVLTGNPSDYSAVVENRNGREVWTLTNQQTGETETLINIEKVEFQGIQAMVGMNPPAGPQTFDIADLPDVMSVVVKVDIPPIPIRDTVRIGTEGADLIQGGAGDQQIFGRGGDDTLKGGAGDDRLSGGPGNNTLQGGTGTDTAVLAGILSDYEASIGFQNGKAIWVLTNTQTGDVQRLINIEKVVFTGSSAMGGTAASSGAQTVDIGSLAAILPRAFR